LAAEVRSFITETQPTGQTLVTPLIAVAAYLKLVEFDLYLYRRSFSALYERVRKCPLDQERIPPPRGADQICEAIDLACIWYWKHVLCLQRSAATTCLLRRYGIPAQMVIGAQHLPFRAHAWVEVNGLVLNDKPYTPEMYSVLDRC
jgi:transglutaminase superfamily protein